MGDEEDRAQLAQMTVLKREQILAERQAKRDSWKEKFLSPKGFKNLALNSIN